MSNDTKGCSCAAYGCPMPGSMTMNTTGTSEWFCGHHFGRSATKWAAITAELNRLGWLVHALQSLRAAYRSEHWPSTVAAARKVITLNQRKDLLYGERESGFVWMQRLDRVLTDACSVNAPTALQLVTAANSDTWKKLELEVPEHML